MKSQNNSLIPTQKKGGNNMYTLEQTKQIINANPYTLNLTVKEQEEILNSKDNTRKFKITTKLNTEDYPCPATDYYITELPPYKLSYKEHCILRQAAYHNMQAYNKLVKYNKDLTHTTNQELRRLYKTKNTSELLDIIDRYLDHQEKQNNKKIIEHNQEQIIIPALQNLTDQQVEHYATKLQRLEELYYLQLDTDYTDKQSIITSYQQVLMYIEYKIPMELRETEEELYGNTDIIDQQYYEYYHPYSLEDVLDEETIEQYSIERSA